MNEQMLGVLLCPRILWVGIGCQKGTAQKLIEIAIEQVFQDYQLTQRAIAGIATIDSKASEAGIIKICSTGNLLLKTFPAEILATLRVPNPAKIPENKIGTPSVAEAAAILAASGLPPIEYPSLRLGKTIEELGVSLLVPKQIFRRSEQIGAVTIAVAKAVKIP